MDPFIVGIGGTTRIGSSSERLTSAVLTATERLGARTIMFGGAKLAELPHYAPESSVRTAAECELVEAVRAADGLVIGTPGYHGGISGLVKNAIDLLEDTRQDARVYFDGMPVGLVVLAAGWQALGHACGRGRDARLGDADRHHHQHCRAKRIRQQWPDRRCGYPMGR